eukprot:3770013-Amphidinium_carterae.2
MTSAQRKGRLKGFKPLRPKPAESQSHSVQIHTHSVLKLALVCPVLQTGLFSGGPWVGPADFGGHIAEMLWGGTLTCAKSISLVIIAT